MLTKIDFKKGSLPCKIAFRVVSIRELSTGAMVKLKKHPSHHEFMSPQKSFDKSHTCMRLVRRKALRELISQFRAFRASPVYPAFEEENFKVSDKTSRYKACRAKIIGTSFV